MAAARPRPSTVTFVDADGVNWTVRAQRRRSAVLGFDGSTQTISWEFVLIFTSEFGEMRRGVDPVSENWMTEVPLDELKIRCARALRIGRGPGFVES